MAGVHDHGRWEQPRKSFVRSSAAAGSAAMRYRGPGVTTVSPSARLVLHVGDDGRFARDGDVSERLPGCRGVLCDFERDDLEVRREIDDRPDRRTESSIDGHPRAGVFGEHEVVDTL
ncbi:MAG: hypothetical protein ABEJ05_09435 [Haloglomus sp.]